MNNPLIIAVTVAATNLRKIAGYFKAQGTPPSASPTPTRSAKRDPLAVYRPPSNAPPRIMPGAAVA